MNKSQHITACIRNSGFSGKSKVNAFNKSKCFAVFYIPTSDKILPRRCRLWGYKQGRDAFQQAGAKTVLMSLWKVSDEATQILMIEFYSTLLKGKPKREAFKIAELKLREKFESPYYWGAFVMVGR